MPDEQTPEPEQSPNSPTTPTPRQDQEKRADRRVAIISVISTALLGVLGVTGTIIGSKLSVDASIRNQDLQAAEQRAKEDRDNRADAYFKFADAADRYGAAASAAYDCARRTLRLAPPPNTQPNSIGCDTEIATLSTNHYSFLAAKSKVYAYGSEAAEEESTAMAHYLPTNKAEVLELDFNKDRFVNMYQNFMRIICGELPAEPRASCK